MARLYTDLFAAVCLTLLGPHRTNHTVAIIPSPCVLVFLELPISNHQPAPPSQLAHQLAPAITIISNAPGTFAHHL